MNYTREQLLEAADILDRAHDVILQRGWWPGNNSVNHEDNEARCIDAAIGEALGRNVQCCTMLGAAYPPPPQWLWELMRESGISWQWNDMATEDEVFDRVRTVAKQLRDEAGATNDCR